MVQWRRFAIMLAVVLLPTVSHAQDRGLTVQAREAAGSDSFDPGRQYAVIIGIDRYAEWPPLKNAVADAREVRAILAERYYIDEFIELYDSAATNRAIRQLFSVELPSKLRPQDSLLVFYAGHGYLDASKNGSWIPVDGGADSIGQERWIPNATLRNYLSATKAQRLLVVADSCFSGDLLAANRGAPPTIDSAYFRKALSLTSRQVLTSGAAETVPDESEFARQLKNALTRNSEPYLDPVMLYERVRKGVTATLPLFGTLPGHEAGASFVLFLKDRPSAVSAGGMVTEPAEPATTGAMEVARPSGTLKVQVAQAARILVDGVDKGDLPAMGIGSIVGIEAGPRGVEARYADGRSEQAKVSVVAGGVASVVFSMAAETFRNSLGMAMVPVEGGTFIMGNPYGEDDQKPAREVGVSAFSISSTEVTVGAFSQFLGETDPKGGRYKGSVPGLAAAWGVSWHEAVDFCIWLSAKEGLASPYARSNDIVLFDPSRPGYRLPTEAEWEFAARGGNRSSGTAFAGGTGAQEVAWPVYAYTDSEDPTHAVATKKPNELGLYDMNGNVLEWCNDRYGPYTAGTTTDPAGPTSGFERVLRGPGDRELSYRSRFDLRKEFKPSYRMGFRLVRSSPGTRASLAVSDAAIGATCVSEGTLKVDGGKPIPLKQRSGWAAAVPPGLHRLEFTYPDGSGKTIELKVGTMEAATADFGYKPFTSGIETVLVEGGSFTLGSSSPFANPASRPARKVTVASFLAAKTEITRKQFRLVLQADPSWRSTPTSVFESEGAFPDNYPVESVSWRYALLFCNALSALDGLPPAYEFKPDSVRLIPGSKGWRLPTEAEWEFAAMGGNKSKGYKYAGSNDPKEVAWGRGDLGGDPKPVGTKKANELGLYDTSGNVAEWIWDPGFKDAKNELRYPEEPYRVPAEIKFNMYGYLTTLHIFRGGADLIDAGEAEVKYRNSGGGDREGTEYIGFRVVRSTP